MNPELRRKAQDVFHAALEQEGAEQRAFVEQACAGDPDLAAEVESLLVWDGRADSDLERVEGAIAAFAPTPEELAGGERRIGPYRVLEELGQGGLGTVYLAERADEQYRMRVAIKLVRGDRASEELLHRFRQERQILAHLDHAHIARLLDGGTTDGGLPYVVMEYIEGEHIDRYCDRRRLAIDERLELFRRVCSAVHHAHRSLVIHRDIKPSNILVTADGVPKLLDFGIAKLLDPELATPNLTQTAAGMQPLTPEYASPEQIRGEPLTTATDVYSLGVVLYRLLTGHPPYRFPSRRPQDLERVICDSEPRRPSASIDREEPARSPEGTEVLLTPESVSETREGSPEKLRRRLAGDLDNIVLKAMRREPERRYASAEQLAEDLRRHRERRPVLARPDTFAYRTRRFVSRHRLRLAAAAAVLLLTVGLVGFYTHRLQQERDAAKEARTWAEAEADRKEDVLTFLTETFGELDPDKSKGEQISAQELLNDAADRIQGDADVSPDVRAEIMYALGAVYTHRRAFDKAEPLLLESLEIRRRHFGPRHLKVADSHNMLGEVLFLQTRGRDEPEKLDLAYLHIREAAAQRGELLGGEDQRTLTSLNNLAVVERNRGRLQEAEKLYRQILAKRRELDPQGPTVATSLQSLGVVLVRMERWDEALQSYEEALSIKLEAYGTYNQHTADALGNVARFHLQRGSFQKAVDGFSEVRDIMKRLFGEDHVDVARATARLAQSHAALGELAQAETSYREAIGILESNDPTHPRLPGWRQELEEVVRHGRPE